MTDRRVPGRFCLLTSLLGLVLMLTAACGGDRADATRTTVATNPATSDVPTGLAGDLTVFAAASLTDAFTRVQQNLEDANPDLSIDFNFGGSQQLVTQLADGANADLFTAANAAQMAAAQDAGVVDGDPIVFIHNRLAIIVPDDNPAGVREPADLADDGLKLVIAASAVPAGAYTLELLDRLSADPTFGSNFRERVEANIVSLEDSVRQVVTKVRLGEADAGIVYISDVTGDVGDDVAIVEIPDQFNILAEYLVAPVAGGDADLARAFVDYLLSPGGQAVLEAWGFTPLEAAAGTQE